MIVTAYAFMCAIWGTTWLTIKVSLHYAPPLTGAGLRFVIAGAVLYAVAIAGGALRPSTRRFARAQGDRGSGTRDGAGVPWKLVLVLAAFLFGLNYVLTYVAETRLDSGLVAVLFGTLPFFVFGFAHALTAERTTPRIWLGALVAFGGVAVISLGGQVRGSPLFALAAIVAAAVSSFANVYAKRHAHHAPLRTLPPAMLIAGIVVATIGVATEPVSWAKVFSPESIAALLYLGVLGSSVAFFINLWLLARIDAWIVGLSALIIPVIAVIVGIALGGESFTWRELAGSAFVIGGVWIALAKRQSAAELAIAEAEL
ncbi:MAG TPA: EamA family transporter [Candidatus Baltobacteraceae bacterium]|nr:EamA family transporter [Candidatus Baltobacteraceae bacterium]